jgi:hypothetical protein
MEGVAVLAWEEFLARARKVTPEQHRERETLFKEFWEEFQRTHPKAAKRIRLHAEYFELPPQELFRLRLSSGDDSVYQASQMPLSVLWLELRLAPWWERLLAVGIISLLPVTTALILLGVLG